MPLRTYPKLPHLCLGLLALFITAYQVGPAWQEFARRFAAHPSPVDRTLTVLLNLVTPIFTMLLGFAVAIIRPRDRRAWLLLALLLTMGEASREGVNFSTLTDGWRVPATLYNEFGESWGIWLFLFMVYFSEPLLVDRRYPFLKWIVLIAPASIAIMAPARQLGWPLARAYFSSLGGWLYLFAYGFIAVLYSLIGYRYFSARDPDERRRLRLIFWGTIVSLVPQLALLMVRNLTGQGSWNFVPLPVRVVALLLTFLFPLTLAYVVLVQRALDIRVVIRQGLQYALATKGVLVLQIGASFAIVLASTTLAGGEEVNRPQRIILIAGGIMFVFLTRRIADHLRRWIDRRFFREAYQAEQILAALADDVRTIVEIRSLLETVVRRISESLHVHRVAILIREGAVFQPAHALGFSVPQMPVAEGASSIIRLRDSHRALRVDAAAMDGFAAFEPEVLLPLSSRDKLLGVVTLGRKQSDEPYSSSDVQLLESVATQTGLALENSLLAEAIAVEAVQRERLNREIEIAREVQERLFPQSCPPVPGLDYAGTCRPAMGVGGDYYDFLSLPGGLFGIAVGDVSGKGIPAALLMASLHASLHAQTLEGTVDLARLMTNLNRLIYDATQSNRYATFFYAQYDPATRILVWVNAGHNPPMVFRGSEVIRLEDGGPVIGLFKPAVYCQASMALQAGDRLVAYTDGVSEAMNNADEEWGEDQMAQTVLNCDGSASEIAARLLQGADAFADGAPQHDDMTVVVVRLIRE